MNKNQQLNSQRQAIQKKIILTQLFSVPSVIALGFGFYGVFAADGNAFIPALNNLTFCYALIIVGGLVELLTVLKLLHLLKEQSKIRNNYSSK